MAKPKNLPPFLMSIAMTRDKEYFEELYNSINSITEIAVPGKCNFCGKRAWHIIEQVIEDEDGMLEYDKTMPFLCCDEGQCLAKALPELFAKFRALIQGESN